MMTIRNFEATVARLEGFTIRIRHGRDSRDARSDKRIPAKYPYVRRAPYEWTVQEFLQKRLRKRLVGFRVEVTDAHGRRVNGSTKLRTIRRATAAAE